MKLDLESGLTNNAVAIGSTRRILVTPPPMVASKELFLQKAKVLNLELDFLSSAQAVKIGELENIIHKYDGWIIGDDPCPGYLLKNARNGKLKAVVKWGIGMDNIDLEAATELGVAVTNTPLMLGKEVADLALTYMNMLARQVLNFHLSVVAGDWKKPIGVSLKDKKVGIVGFGDIGKNLQKRCQAAEMEVIIYEVNDLQKVGFTNLEYLKWPFGINTLDFLVFACPLTESTRHMFNMEVARMINRQLFLINMSRGEIVAEEVLVEGLSKGFLRGVALDVFEHEPLPLTSRLRQFENVIFGTHNASNTSEAVSRVSFHALEKMNVLLESN